jgi:hypothetical protein
MKEGSSEGENNGAHMHIMQVLSLCAVVLYRKMLTRILIIEMTLGHCVQKKKQTQKYHIEYKIQI